MSTLQKTNVAPDTERHFPPSHYLCITQNTMVLFSAFIHDPGGHRLCVLLKKHLHSYRITDSFVSAGNQELNQRKAQIHTSASEHRPEAE